MDGQFFFFFKKKHQNKYNCQSHMDSCKVYKDNLRSNCIDAEFKQQLKQYILNEF